MKISRLLLPAAICVAGWFTFGAKEAEGQDVLPAPQRLPGGIRIPAPRFPGKALLRDPAGGYRPLARAVRAGGGAADPLVAPVPGTDRYIDDGAETSLAFRPAEDRLVASYNNNWLSDPPTPQASSADGNRSWTLRAFPAARPPVTGYPFDPWSFAGNAEKEFFTCMIWLDETTMNSHCVVAKSTDGGVSFRNFFELQKAVFQDRDMADIDRDEAGGGGPGTDHDGKIFIGYDDYGPGFNGFRGSLVQVVSAAGAAEREVRISASTGSADYRGVHPQPVAGVTDGTVYVMTLRVDDEGTNLTVFHELRNAGAGPNVLEKSTLSWWAGGQDLGGYMGLNGFRTDDQGYLAIDRSPGPRRGTLYFIANRNPNPTNLNLDQGDIVVSISTDGAATWSGANVPTPNGRGKTQYFPMLDVDEQGFIHVAYYQNESGSVNGGVLNANLANVYYTLSTDGARTWSAPVRVNSAANSLRFPDPPPDRTDQSFYLIGDYAQLKAAGTADGVRAHLLWTGYDDRRRDDMPGQAKRRVLCTTVDTPLGYLRRGDANFDKAQDLADVIFTLSYLFVDPAPAGGACELSMDSTADGRVDISDPIALLFYLFEGAPAAPFLECVADKAGACGRSFCY